MGIYSPVPVEKLIKEKVGTVIFSIKLPFAGQYLIEGSYDKEKGIHLLDLLKFHLSM